MEGSGMELLEVDGLGEIGRLNQEPNKVSGGPQAGLSRMSLRARLNCGWLVVFVAASF
jgi:hypothetical protein